MAKPYYLLLFILAVALAYSQSQTPAPGSSSNSQSTPANTSGSIYGNTTSANPQSPAQGTTPSQPLPGTTQSAPATTPTPGQTRGTDASGGGVAGAAGSGAAQTQVPDTPATTANPPIPDSELQSQIQNALTKEPTLSGESVRVSVAEDNIEMSGNVGSPREKLTATRIVQSYAGNKKVVNHLTVGGHSGANSSSPASHGSANPASNPEPNKGAPPSGSSQPPRG